MNVRDKRFYDLFASFIDFRKPYSYNLSQEGGQAYLSLKIRKRKGAIPPNENKFIFKRYGGKNGLDLTRLLSVRYPSPSSVDTEFVFVGDLKNGVFFFYFETPLPRLILKTADPFFQAQYGDTTENQRLPDGFIDKRVIFMAKFTRVGVACNLIVRKDNSSHSFTFAPKSYTFTTIGFSPPKDDSYPIEFFGLADGDNLLTLYRFLMEEKYRK